MVKKLKKYVKFVVCYSLIMSLIATSYAALSASDGSAFVTKAEFDAALADFNSRLTTFEAGINSKIDSQVTSYLDRNGIWNGATQNVTGTNSIFPKMTSGSGTTGLQTQINETTKGGLLFVNWQYCSDATNARDSRWGYLLQLAGVTNWYADCGFVVSLDFVEQLAGTSAWTVRNSNMLGACAATKALSENNTYGKYGTVMLNLPLSSAPMQLSSLMFVSKGSRIAFRYSYNIRNTNAGDFDSGSTSRIQAKFISASIY